MSKFAMVFGENVFQFAIFFGGKKYELVKKSRCWVGGWSLVHEGGSTDQQTTRLLELLRAAKTSGGSPVDCRPFANATRPIDKIPVVWKNALLLNHLCNIHVL